MEEPGFTLLSPDQLRTLMAKQREADYLLVDVRQPQEYATSHIPGAQLMPLSELQTRLFSLPEDRDLIFYCHSGGRSAYAAELASEAEVTRRGVYNLLGGVVAWEGKLLADYPRVALFEKQTDPKEMLMTAMDLEKGAHRFYGHFVTVYRTAPFHGTLVKLAQAETGHARMLYRFWSPLTAEPEPFESLFEKLPGEILEGGENLIAVMKRIEQDGSTPCLRVLETALHIEYTAYDLYRHMAEQVTDESAKEAFLSIAQAEKAHMQALAEAVSQCD